MIGERKITAVPTKYFLFVDQACEVVQKLT
jgi:hypothetical protein